MSEWLGIEDAARRLGLSQSAVRRRLRGGKLRSRQESTDQGFRWLIEVEDAPNAQAAPTPDLSAAEAAAEAAPTPNDQAGELAIAQAAAALLTTHNQELRAELAARREEVSRLIVLLREAQRSLPAPVDAQAAEAARARPEDRDLGAAESPPTPSVPWWRRFLGLAAPA